MTAVFLLISVFAYRTWISEGNYRRMLSEEYIRAAGEYTVTEDPQHALLYYTQGAFSGTFFSVGISGNSDTASGLSVAGEGRRGRRNP